MIRTGDFTEGKVTITEGINEKNFSFIKNLYETCDLYINSKFDNLPFEYKKSGILGGKARNVIVNNLSNLEQSVRENRNDVIKGETPLKNFEFKIDFWCNNMFKSVLDGLDSSKVVRILIDNKLTKHESLCIAWLADAGAQVTIVDSEYQKLVRELLDMATLELCGTTDKLIYIEEVAAAEALKQKQTSFSSFSDIETAIDNGKRLNALVLGTAAYGDTCDFYGAMHRRCEQYTDWELCINRFIRPTLEDVQKIPRFTKLSHDFVLHTVCTFIKSDSEGGIEVANNLKEKVEKWFNRPQYKNLEGEIFYNRVVNVVATINVLLKNNIKTVVYYGTAKRNDTDLLCILGNSNCISVIVLMSDKNMINSELRETFPTLELENSVEFFDMPISDSRTAVKTMAASAKQNVQQCFNGVLGMYKPGTFRTCETKLFIVAFEELNLWWNTEMYLRPKFEARGDVAVLPVIFKVIQGVNDDQAIDKYLATIQSFCFGNTLLCKSVGELQSLGNVQQVNNSMNIRGAVDFGDRKLRKGTLIRNGHIDKAEVKQLSNYRYGHLSPNKQDLILDTIDKIINGDYIDRNGMDNMMFTDMVLNTLLRLNNMVLNACQWFEFYTDNPNLILLLNDEQRLDTVSAILLVFLHFIGIDILIFVPTCYSSIEQLVTPRFQFEVDRIGLAQYNINMNMIQVIREKEQAQKLADDLEVKKKPKKFLGIF